MPPVPPPPPPSHAPPSPQTFHPFPHLPLELQLKIYKHAFHSTSGLSAWLSFGQRALHYLLLGLPIPRFWTSGGYALRPGLAIILGGPEQRRVVVYRDESIPTLMCVGRVARMVGLEVWRGVLRGLLGPLGVPCEGELGEVERALEGLRRGWVGGFGDGEGRGI